MKRLIICCDGTWQSALNDHDVPSNIVKISGAIKPRAKDGTSQIFFYDAGVGTDGGFDKLTGGVMGAGIDLNIKNAYLFLVNNYESGDQILLFGFSRGAYTVRSLAGLINNAGVLKKENALKLNDAYELYRNPAPEAHPKQDLSVNFRREYSYVQDNEECTNTVVLHFLGVFDTVGALGIPSTILSALDGNCYNFHDHLLNRRIKFAYQALALDERRWDFIPVLWEVKKPEGIEPGTTSEQRWFVGAHSDIGGGYQETGLSDITLKWMLTMARERVGIEYIEFQGHEHDSAIPYLSSLTGQPLAMIHQPDTYHEAGLIKTIAYTYRGSMVRHACDRIRFSALLHRFISRDNQGYRRRIRSPWGPG